MFVVKNNHLIVDYELDYFKERRLIGKVCNNGFDNANDPDTVGNFLYPFASECFVENKDGHLYFVALEKDIESESIQYFVGFDKIESISGYDNMSLTSGYYAVFKYKGLFREHIPTILNDLYKSIALSNFTLKDMGLEFIEVYDEKYLENYEFEIHVPVKI